MLLLLLCKSRRHCRCRSKCGLVLGCRLLPVARRLQDVADLPLAVARGPGVGVDVELDAGRRRFFVVFILVRAVVVVVAAAVVAVPAMVVVVVAAAPTRTAACGTARGSSLTVVVAAAAAAAAVATAAVAVGAVAFAGVGGAAGLRRSLPLDWVARRCLAHGQRWLHKRPRRRVVARLAVAATTTATARGFSSVRSSRSGGVEQSWLVVAQA